MTCDKCGHGGGTLVRVGPRRSGVYRHQACPKLGWKHYFLGCRECHG
jgi:hypothetical protein